MPLSSDRLNRYDSAYCKLCLFYSLQDVDFDLTNVANILDIPSVRYASPFKKLTRATVDILNI